MTREEAIEELKCYHREDGTIPEEIPMAIKALEQEPCDDAISRQAVLDYLKANVDDFPDYHEAIEKVLQMPPVTQKTETVTEFADRCRGYGIWRLRCKGIRGKRRVFCKV